MKTFLLRALPEQSLKLNIASIGLTVFLAGLLTLWGVYAIEDYGYALFVLVPFFLGANPVLLYGLKRNISRKDSYLLGLLTLFAYTLALMLFAIEGILCLIMAAPIAFILTLAGSYTGYRIINKKQENAPLTMLLMLMIIPTFAFIEKDNEPSLTSVVTSIEINASQEEIWKNVVEFPELDGPTELIFKAGIAYPINAKIEGQGVGAVRHCNFTTGSFVEPITIWNEANLLKFDVLEQPEPLKEISFWDIDAPHLHDYFVSKQGQFKLTKLKNGHTLLEGTTWYYHNIRPEFYWKLWSNYIVHKIHFRVLEHIKKNSEKDKGINH
jgi:hypothetical protein